MSIFFIDLDLQGLGLHPKAPNLYINVVDSTACSIPPCLMSTRGSSGVCGFRPDGRTPAKIPATSSTSAAASRAMARQARSESEQGSELRFTVRGSGV